MLRWAESEVTHAPAGRAGAVVAPAYRIYTCDPRISVDAKIYVGYAYFMRAKELIPILSEIWGIPFDTAWVLDRSLADAGLRNKGKGRTPPDMTRADALRFLIAYMTAPVATRAAEDVAHWCSFRWKPLDPNCEEHGSADEAELEDMKAALMLEAKDAPYKEYPMGYKVAIVDRAAKLADAAGEIGLLDYLLLLTAWLAEGGEDPSNVRFEIITSRGEAAVRFEKHSYGEIHTDHFFGSKSQDTAGDEAAGVFKSSYVFGEALLAIAARTADPLKVEG